MALALMIRTQLWLAGEVSAHRDMTLIRRLIERVRRCAAPRPLLVCIDGLNAYVRAILETFRDPVRTGALGCTPGKTSVLRKSSSAMRSGAWSTSNAALWMARQRASRCSGIARKVTA